jgi:hypothetical protein
MAWALGCTLESDQLTDNPKEAGMSTTEDGSSGASGRVQQAPGLWRTDLQQQDLSVPGREVVQARVDIGPEAPFVNAGEALTVPAGAVHAVRNVGSGNAAELATYVVEKGKPLITVVE